MTPATMRRALGRLLRRLGWPAHAGRRGSVAVIVAVSMIPLAIATGAAVDLSRMASARAALQRAVDNAALSGAAAYVLYTQGDSFNAIAKTEAKAAFCNAVTSLPGGFVLAATGGSTACSTGQGAAITAVIGGYSPGTRGNVVGSGCTANHTVVANATCGFIVSVSATATVPTIFPFLLGGTAVVSVTASAINPFINLAKALSPTFNGSARYTDSLWVYPLLLDANGSPDFITNKGALPDASACTGNPTQTSCGNYTMIASTLYVGCVAGDPACTVNGTTFIDGVVQNPVAGNVVITATTPLGIALESTAGAATSYGYNAAPKTPNVLSCPGNLCAYQTSPGTSPPNSLGCSWPHVNVYKTVTQTYDAFGNAQLVDASGHWSLATHWFYSSFLANNDPPDQNEIDVQTAGGVNAATGIPNNDQVIPPLAYQATEPVFNRGTTYPPSTCPNATEHDNIETFPTAYATSGNTNCALYITKDPATLTPNPAYKVINGQTPTCFTPSATPGAQYAALSCQNYAGHNYGFFWNDMGGQVFDDTDYYNGVLQVSCSGASYVVLMN